MPNYPPQQHQDDNREHMIAVIHTYPLAMLVSVKDNTPLISHLPLVYSDGKLIGHMDKYNPQAELLKDNNDVTVVFSGPQCYISPSIYSTTQLPTWNYVMVHLKGKVKEITDQETINQSMIHIIRFFAL